MPVTLAAYWQKRKAVPTGYCRSHGHSDGWCEKPRFQGAVQFFSWPTTTVPQVAVGDIGGASTDRVNISSIWPRTSAGNCCAQATSPGNKQASAGSRRKALAIGISGRNGRLGSTTLSDPARCRAVVKPHQSTSANLS